MCVYFAGMDRVLPHGIKGFCHWHPWYTYMFKLVILEMTLEINYACPFLTIEETDVCGDEMTYLMVFK